MFVLDQRLAQDTFDCGRLELCRVLLMNDSRYPWFILVPQREGIREIHHLSEADQLQLWAESRRLALWMEGYFAYDKLNVAALGNVVSQLHLHHVGRCSDDPAWPGPVWGHSPAVAYDPVTAELLQQVLAAALGC
ncbi:MAG: HIT domain-containing protein [Desulfuromonadales bacterium]|nr:HIT domain-containing protein [Desulfuromonadales bacterium]MBN2791050.1 HIT domain-containing protein [Desulfuromonadales bacterium]